MKTITKSFSLATDGMTETEVNAFKLHFKPGKYGKLIEDKLACRYGYARISNTSSFSVVPFIKKKEITIGDKKHIVEINEYKGTAKLTFVFDSPLWYATNSKISSTEELSSDKLREVILNGIPIEGHSWSSSQGALFLGDSILNNSGTANKNKDLIKFYNPSTASTKTRMSITFTP
jgi:hypothetical protein